MLGCSIAICRISTRFFLAAGKTIVQVSACHGVIHFEEIHFLGQQPAEFRNGHTLIFRVLGLAVCVHGSPQKVRYGHTRNRDRVLESQEQPQTRTFFRLPSQSIPMPSRVIWPLSTSYFG